MLFSGGLLVGTTLPANALDAFTVSQAGDTSMLASAIEVQGQKIEVSEDIAPILAERDSFEVKSWADQLRDRYGTRGSYSYSVGTGGTVRWPFPYYVPISSGYGERAAPCRGCSTTHNAIDLTPGAGAPIYAIADGVVIRREPRGGSWGNNLTIEHKVNGQTVTSSYAHMQWDSSPIELGDTIKVGDFVGLVGATGQATGAHLHLEIKVNGSYVNPYTWLKENAG
jgi:murein DD-endopeptidase MepM/ murein hydrolase activator NlpD